MPRAAHLGTVCCHLPSTGPASTQPASTCQAASIGLQKWGLWLKEAPGTEGPLGCGDVRNVSSTHRMQQGPCTSASLLHLAPDRDRA